MATFILILLLLIYIGMNTVVEGAGNFLVTLRNLLHRKKN